MPRDEHHRPPTLHVEGLYEKIRTKELTLVTCTRPETGTR